MVDDRNIATAIPLSILTRTDPPSNVLYLRDYAATLSTAQVVTDLMFAPFIACASITTKFLRFVDGSVEERPARYSKTPL